MSNCGLGTPAAPALPVPTILVGHGLGMGVVPDRLRQANFLFHNTRNVSNCFLDVDWGAF